MFKEITVGLLAPQCPRLHKGMLWRQQEDAVSKCSASPRGGGLAHFEGEHHLATCPRQRCGSAQPTAANGYFFFLFLDIKVKQN